MSDGKYGFPKLPSMVKFTIKNGNKIQTSLENDYDELLLSLVPNKVIFNASLRIPKIIRNQEPSASFDASNLICRLLLLLLRYSL